MQHALLQAAQNHPQLRSKAHSPLDSSSHPLLGRSNPVGRLDSATDDSTVLWRPSPWISSRRWKSRPPRSRLLLLLYVAYMIFDSRLIRPRGRSTRTCHYSTRVGQPARRAIVKEETPPSLGHFFDSAQIALRLRIPTCPDADADVALARGPQ
ncbi:hypothetical protein B0H11DRAFT_269298, partial [Mycena galericulata]